MQFILSFKTVYGNTELSRPPLVCSSLPRDKWQYTSPPIAAGSHGLHMFLFCVPDSGKVIAPATRPLSRSFYQFQRCSRLLQDLGDVGITAVQILQRPSCEFDAVFIQNVFSSEKPAQFLRHGAAYPFSTRPPPR